MHWSSQDPLGPRCTTLEFTSTLNAPAEATSTAMANMAQITLVEHMMLELDSQPLLLLLLPLAAVCSRSGTASDGASLVLQQSSSRHSAILTSSKQFTFARPSEIVLLPHLGSQPALKYIG